MSPRRPSLVLLPALALAAGLSGCGQRTDPAPAAAPAARTVGPTDTPPADHSPADPALPDDLALDVDLDRGDSDALVKGPGRAVRGTSFADLCSPGPGLWPGPVVDRLVTTESGPEYLQVREAALYADAAAASAVLEGLRTQLQACPQDGDRVFADLGTGDTGTDDSLTFGMHYREGLGGTAWLVARHDEVLVLLADSGEASEESLRPMASGLARSHATVWGAIGPQLG